MRAAGVRKPQNARNFIECLPCRIVQRTAEDAEFVRALRVQNGGVPAAGKQGDKGRLERCILQIRRGKVPADMVDADERNIQSVCKPLGKGQPDEERAQQPRAVGHGDGVQLLFLDVCRLEGARNDLVHCLRMGARGDLGYDAAVLCLRRRRGRDLVR